MKKENRSTKPFELPAHRHLELAEQGISYNREIVKFRPFEGLKEKLKEATKK